MTSDPEKPQKPESPERPTGPEDPRGPEGPDAAAPPGGPLRTDEPATSDGGRLEESASDGDVDASKATRPEDPQPEPPDGAIHARTQTDQVNEELQEENAGTALDQPSDGSGGE